MKDTVYSSQTVTVAIIFGSIGVFLAIFILYLVIKQRLKMQRYARNQQRLKESRSSEVFIKKSTSNSTNKSSTKFNLNPKQIDDKTQMQPSHTVLSLIADDNDLDGMRLDDDLYKYLGISLSEIPFIDESTSNTCQNSYMDLPAAVSSSSSKCFNYQPLLT